MTMSKTSSPSAASPGVPVRDSFGPDVGVIPALITPMNEDGSIAYPQLNQLLERMKIDGIQWVLALGSTGEPHSLTDEEWKSVCTFAINKGHEHGLKVMIGSSNNCTAKSLEMTKYANREGADAVFLTCPYYNKPSPRMLQNYFRTLCSVIPHLPIMIYNIPSRTGINIDAETASHICLQNANIVGYKEATTNFDQYKALRTSLPPRVALYTGECSELFHALENYGFHGVVSASANAIGSQLVEVHRLFRHGKKKEAKTLQDRCAPIIEFFFEEPNPCPVKYAISTLIDGATDMPREPLMPILPTTRTKVDEQLKLLEVRR